jgi:chromosomal replication initiator protein
VEKPVDHMWGLARDEQSMSEADLAEVWARSLDELAEMHIEPAQRAWLQLTRPLGLVENTALIATPNEFVKEQLETRLRSLITNALSRELGRSIQLAVTVDPAVISAMPLAGGHEHPMPAMPADAEPGSRRASASKVLRPAARAACVSADVGA